MVIILFLHAAAQRPGLKAQNSLNLSPGLKAFQLPTNLPSFSDIYQNACKKTYFAAFEEQTLSPSGSESSPNSPPKPVN